MGRPRRIKREQRRFIKQFKRHVGTEAAKHFPGFTATLNDFPFFKRIWAAMKLAAGRL